MRRLRPILFAMLGVIGLRGTDARVADGATTTSDVALRHDGAGALPTVGDQRASSSCVSWAVRTIAAHHYRRHAPPWWQFVLRVPRWRWHPPFGLEVATISVWIRLPKPDLADPSNWPSVAYLHNLELRRSIARNLNPAGQSLETWIASGGDPLGYTLNVVPAVGTLAQCGAPSERLAPFTSCATELPTGPQIASAGTLRHRWARAIGTCSEMSPHDSPDALRTALESGPALVMLSVYEDFGCGVQAEYEPRTHGDWNCYLGTHAIVAVAFDPGYRGPDGTREPTAAFRLMNSWGPYWGDRGYTWVTAAHLFGSDTGTNLVTSIFRFDSPATAPEPAQDESYPPNWLPGVAAPWEGDPEREFCLQRSAADCEPPPQPTPCADQPPRYADRPPSYAERAPRLLDLALAAGARAQIFAPPVPLVPALFASTVRYWVDGEPAETVDPAKTGFAFRFVARTGSSPSPAPSPADVPKHAKKAPAYPGVGADPTTIGVFVDRAILEIVDPANSHLAIGQTIRVRAEVYDPCAGEPRAVVRYRVRVVK